MFVLLTSLIISLLNIYFSNIHVESGSCVSNSGIAFGLMVGNEFLLAILILLTLTVVGLLSKGKIKYLFFSLVLLGTSNLYIRVQYGAMCDYISLPKLFVNLADIFIVLISIYLVIYIWFTKRKGD